MALKDCINAKNNYTDYFYVQIEGAFEEKDFRAKVTREEFEDMCSGLLKRVSGPVEQALKSSAIPLVRKIDHENSFTILK